MRLLDEVIEHLLGDLEVRDDAVLHRTDGDDVARRAPEHLLGLRADGLDAVGDVVDGHDRRFANDDSLAPREDERVRRPQVHGQVVGEDRKNGFESHETPLSREA